MARSNWMPAHGDVRPDLHGEGPFLAIIRDPMEAERVADLVRDAGASVDTTHAIETARPLLAAHRHPVVLLDADIGSREQVNDIVALGRAGYPERVFVLLTRGERAPFDLTGLDGHADALVGVLRRPLDRNALLRVVSDAAALHGWERHAGRCDDLVVPLGRVLHVEDSELDAMLVSRVLSDRNGLTLHRVRDLAEAESALLTEDFDLALVDLHLPDARGFDVLHRLRALRPELPVVVLSGLSARVRGRALSLGAPEVVDKAELASEAVYQSLLRAKLRGDAQRELRYLATHDALTGLRNGAAFREQLSLSIARVRRQGDGCALLYIDLDGFKPINDSHGHDAGDAVLRVVGERLREVLRDCDLAARLGGDEFAALLNDVQSVSAAAAAAERVLASLSEPIVLPGGASVEVTASVGIALCPGTAEAAHPLMRAADAAMFGAKQAGKNRYCLARADRNGGMVSDVHALGPAVREIASR